MQSQFIIHLKVYLKTGGHRLRKMFYLSSKHETLKKKDRLNRIEVAFLVFNRLKYNGIISPRLSKTITIFKSSNCCQIWSQNQSCDKLQTLLKPIQNDVTSTHYTIVSFKRIFYVNGLDLLVHAFLANCSPASIFFQTRKPNIWFENLKKNLSRSEIASKYDVY